MLTESELVKGINEIPPLPVAVSESMTLLNSKAVDFNQLQKAIAQDAGLSGRVLKVANSPFYGLAGQVGSIKEACVILGTHTLRNIVLAIGMMCKFPPESANNLNLSGLWHHSYCTGVTARLLAKKVGVDPEKAFTAGLLHDIGKMVLDVYFSAYYSDVITYQKENNCLLAEAESSVLGITHSLVGEKLAACWHLPEDIISSIGGHHDTAGATTTPMSDIVHISDIVSRSLDYGHPGDNLMPTLSEDSLNRLDLSLNDIRDELENIDNIMSTANELLG